MGKKYTKEEIQEACTELRALVDWQLQQERPKFLRKDAPVQVHAVVRSVAKSGMSRWMDFYILENEDYTRITHWIARLLGWRFDADKGLRVEGCGMDMGFHTLDCVVRAYGRHMAEIDGNDSRTDLQLERQVRYL